MLLYQHYVNWMRTYFTRLGPFQITDLNWTYVPRVTFLKLPGRTGDRHGDRCHAEGQVSDQLLNQLCYHSKGNKCYREAFPNPFLRMPRSGDTETWHESLSHQDWHYRIIAGCFKNRFTKARFSWPSKFSAGKTGSAGKNCGSKPETLRRTASHCPKANKPR